MKLSGKYFDVVPTFNKDGKGVWQWSVNTRTAFIRFGTCFDKSSAVLAARNFIKRNQALVFGEG